MDQRLHCRKNYCRLSLNAAGEYYFRDQVRDNSSGIISWVVKDNTYKVPGPERSFTNREQKISNS